MSVAGQLFVEGVDDQRAIIHFLIRNGIDYDNHRRSLPAVEKVGDDDSNPDQGKDALLREIELAVPLATKRAVGFVFDADSPLQNRWEQIRGRLHRVGVETPGTPPASGFIGHSSSNARVGVWLMPDNVRDGALETFLRELVSEGDKLIGPANKAADNAKDLGAKFPDVHHPKAVLHTWLAWQENPGRPYGTALRAKYFGVDSPAARAFVDWFRTLFRLVASPAT